MGHLDPMPLVQGAGRIQDLQAKAVSQTLTSLISHLGFYLLDILTEGPVLETPHSTAVAKSMLRLKDDALQSSSFCSERNYVSNSSQTP